MSAVDYKFTISRDQGYKDIEKKRFDFMADEFFSIQVVAVVYLPLQPNSGVQKRTCINQEWKVL